MDSEHRMEIAKILSETDPSMEEIQKSISKILNGMASVEDFQKIVNDWQEKRKLINNLGSGILISFSKVNIITFPLKGDLKQDIGQKTFSDAEFLESIHIKREENSNG